MTDHEFSQRLSRFIRLTAAMLLAAMLLLQYTARRLEALSSRVVASERGR